MRPTTTINTNEHKSRFVGMGRLSTHSLPSHRHRALWQLGWLLQSTEIGIYP